MIKAISPILYRGRDYSIGDVLPEDDPVMVSAWIEAGSAKEEPEATETIEKAKVTTSSAKKARPKSARPGRTGKVDSGGRDELDDDLVGVAPRRK